MKILRLIESADPKKGGPIAGIRASNEILIARNIHVTVATLDSPSATFLQTIPCSQIEALGPPKTKLSFSANYSKWLNSNIQDYDAVIIHGVWQWSSIGALSALRNFSGKVYLFPHGSFDAWDSEQNRLGFFVKKLYFYLFEKHVVNAVSKIFFTSTIELQNSLKKFNLPENKCTVVRYGLVDLEVYKNESERKNILFLSRVHPKKGLELLVTALSQINNDWQLTIAGDGDSQYVESVKTLVSDKNLSERVSFVGHVTGAEKLDLIKSNSVFILPSFQENFGLAVAEVMRAGMPVIISNHVNIFECVEDYNSGFVCERNLESLVDKLKSYFSLSNSEYEKMSLNAKRCFKEKLTINGFVDDLLKMIEKSSSS